MKRSNTRWAAGRAAPLCLMVLCLMMSSGCEDETPAAPAPLDASSLTDTSTDRGESVPDAQRVTPTPDAMPDASPLRDAGQDAAIPLFPCEAIAPPSAQQIPGPQGDGTKISITGRGLTPAGENRLLDGIPGSVALHPGGEWAYILTQGRDVRRLVILSMADFTVSGEVDLDEAYEGLVVTNDGSRVYASGGDHGIVARFTVADDGALIREPNIETGGYPAGMALSADESVLYVALFDQPTLLAVDAESGAVRQSFALPEIPWGVHYVAATNIVFAGNLGGTDLFALDPTDGELLARMPFDRSPAGMTSAPAGDRLWVAIADADAVAAIDPATLEVIRVGSVLGDGPMDDAGPTLPNTNVNSLAYDVMTNRVFAARGADNAISVLDGDALTFLGAIPTGEYPADLALSADGRTMVVAEARGGNPRPNRGLSPKSAISGSATRIDLSVLNLDETTAQVEANLQRPNTAFPFQCDGFFPIPTRRGQSSPIEHVFLVVKENKTFDCVFGGLADMDVDVDPSLVRWGEDITPNLHALARQFSLADNFYVEVEDSDVGHVLLTATHLTEYVHRIWMEKDRSRQIPEGYQIGEGAVPKTGNFFTHLMDHDVSIRIYGEIVGMFATPQVAQGIPFDYSDGNYPGGPFINYAVTDEAKARYVVERIEAGDVAQFTYIALPNDHTVGTRAGQPTPESMVADNDYAVGLLVEGLARSDLWEKSVVFILQDDPQGCEDHVDVHRSPLIVASPWAKRGHVSHAHGSFASVFATIERILGVPPMGRADATAAPLWDLFDAGGDDTPFAALPRRTPVAINGARLPGSRLSELMDFRGPDRNPALAAVLDAYRLWKMGRISLDEAHRRVREPTIALERWGVILEEAVEERFAFDRDFRRYQALMKARGQPVDAAKDP